MTQVYLYNDFKKAILRLIENSDSYQQKPWDVMMITYFFYLLLKTVRLETIDELIGLVDRSVLIEELRDLIQLLDEKNDDLNYIISDLLDKIKSLTELIVTVRRHRDMLNLFIYTFMDGYERLKLDQEQGKYPEWFNTIINAVRVRVRRLSTYEN